MTLNIAVLSCPAAVSDTAGSHTVLRQRHSGCVSTGHSNLLSACVC